MANAMPPRKNTFYVRGMSKKGRGLLKKTPEHSCGSGSSQNSELQEEIQRQNRELEKQRREIEEMRQATASQNARIAEQERIAAHQQRVAKQQATTAAWMQGCMTHWQTTEMQFPAPPLNFYSAPQPQSQDQQDQGSHHSADYLNNVDFADS